MVAKKIEEEGAVDKAISKIDQIRKAAGDLERCGEYSKEHKCRIKRLAF